MIGQSKCLHTMKVKLNSFSPILNIHWVVPNGDKLPPVADHTCIQNNS